MDRLRLFGFDRIRLLVASAMAVGIALRFWGITWGLTNANVSRRPHPDEWPVYWLFRWFGEGRPLDVCPHAPSSCFFDWGALFPYTAYAVHAVATPVFSVLPPGIFGPRADPVFVYDDLAARITSAGLSALAILAVYLLGREAFDRRVGALAACIVALAALPIQLAHFGTPDSESFLLVTACLWRSVVITRRPSFRNVIIAAVLLGLSAGNEYHLALLALPLAAALAAARMLSARNIASAIVVALASFLIVNPYIAIDASGFWAATVHTLRIRTVDSSAEYQGRFNAYGPAWAYVVRFALGYGVTVPITGWFVLGVLAAVWRRNRAEVVLLAWLLPYFALVSLSPAKFMRYSAPLIPALAVVAAAVAVQVLMVARPSVRRATVAVVTAGLLYAFIYDGAYAGLFSSPDPRTVAAQTVLRQPNHVRGIAFEELPDGLVNLPYYLDNRGARTCFANFKTWHLAGANYLLTDEYSAEEHPRIDTAQVDRFLGRLASQRGFHLIATISYVPTFLGIRFPISASPHDWRYPAHVVAVYRVPASQSNRIQGTQCYPNVEAAVRVLYPREIRAAAQASAGAKKGPALHAGPS